MIISHRLKFAFFRIPKTGSTTTEIILRMTGLFDENDFASHLQRFRIPPINLPEFNPDMPPKDRPRDGHATPTDAIADGLITKAQLIEYDSYATLRDPLARSISVFAHAMGQPGLLAPEGFKILTAEHRDFGILERPQTEYFLIDGDQVLTPLDFSDFVGSIRRMIVKLHANPEAVLPTEMVPLIPNFNVTRGKDASVNKTTFIDAESRTILEAKHAGDLALFETNFPGRNP